MADNITAPAAGAVLATDEIGGVHFPKTKIVFGADGSTTNVSTTDRLPVQTQTGLATEAKQDDMIAAIENISPGGGGGGDASAANQDEQTAILTTIDAKLGSPLAVTGSFYPATQPVSGTVGVSGSVAVTGTFWQATQPVSIAGTVGVSGPLTDTQLRAAAVPVSGPLTDTQLRATALPVSAASLPLPSGAGTSAKQDTIITALGTLATQATLSAVLAKIIAAPATEAKQDAMIGHVDGIEGSLTSILAKIIAAPATEAKQDSTITAIATIGTRAYGAAATRLAYAGTSAQSAAITATEVLLHNCGTARCYVKAASSPTATANDIPIEAGEKFHLRITSGHKIAAIQDSAGGNLNIIPVA